MTGHTGLDKAQLNSIYTLWDELADFGAARSDEAGIHLLKVLCQLVDGCDASRFFVVRFGKEVQEDDLLFGWRPSAIRQLNPRPILEHRARDAISRSEVSDIDATTIANMAGVGHFRVHLLSELAPPGWYEEPFYQQFYLSAGHSDAIWAGIPINVDVEVFFGIFRAVDKPPFNTYDKDRVAFILRGLKWLHRAQALNEGFGVALNPLTPQERSVLNGLLHGLPDKSIAARLEQSPHTTREYVKRIYRKFGVTSRSELMALWLGKPPSS